jgi:hypothetical protein
MSDKAMTPEEAWAAKYAGLDAGQLKQRHDALFKELCARTDPELEKLYDAGQYEALGDVRTAEGFTHNVTREEGELPGMWKLVTVHSAPGAPEGESRRVMLPESRYPELYAMHREERWLEKQYRAAEDREAQQANAGKIGSSPR